MTQNFQITIRSPSYIPDASRAVPEAHAHWKKWGKWMALLLSSECPLQLGDLKYWMLSDVTQKIHLVCNLTNSIQLLIRATIARINFLFGFMADECNV